MPLEIEAKMKIDDPAPVRAALRAMGAKLIGEYLEVNTFFDTADRRLLAGDQGLRLRVATDTRTKTDTCRLAHKGPQGKGPIKSREETELTVDSAEGAERLLLALGFAKTLSFEKRRQAWKLGDCEVEIDEMPHLGQFVEIEGPSESAVIDVRRALALEGRPLITTSYIAMIDKWLRERGDKRTDVRFQNPA